MYIIKWKDEVLEKCDTYKEAYELAIQYATSHKGDVVILENTQPIQTIMYEEALVQDLMKIPCIPFKGDKNGN